ncbi:hypothetical protein MMAG44476_28764 [Mycolicibacterium mageritense DSM 44476 = CIP 104973]|uniref:DUF5642 domain-containing protein n=1 Tax=Mycolicibacterium mageritense TaxID=53462 RepID=A0AAI8TUW5_MYCME|nr:DUF5642 family protein [Mycolicibacterium mageritense]MCC9180770.1 DUF5642 family protein [Mycolicibacterium mageritense]BBX34438.1 hypothetical protein MMAGJ_37200 [Mycolicibacterium mageritense]BDY29414.1 hypothetical protein hbim_03352 [Mycolicibacterium mageritense]CDO21043.1 hypothetical protein BN978_01501 [Mycolicibacterium mageritense DSM 44476 = CIP 104973]
MSSWVRLGFVALLTALTVSGCGADAPEAPTGSSPAASAPAVEPAGGYDITRIHELQNQFPPGYTVKPLPPITLTQEQVDQLGGLSGAMPFTFDPPHCDTMLKPVPATAGARSEGLDAQGVEPITVIAVQSPTPARSEVGAGCDHVSVRSPGVAEGTVERIAGPDISGADTMGVRIHLNVNLKQTTRSMDRYTFVATLSPTTAVVVQGDANADVLQDLLTKSVAALRYQ